MARGAFPAAAVLLASLLLAMAAAPARAAARGLLQDDAVPQACINTGLQLQSACTKELEQASSAFGLSPTADVSSIQVDTGRLRSFLTTAPAPTSGCCSAATAFNGAKCSCSPSVLELVKSFTNNDIGQYTEVANWLASKCGFSLLLGSTCPPQK